MHAFKAQRQIIVIIIIITLCDIIIATSSRQLFLWHEEYYIPSKNLLQTAILAISSKCSWNLIKFLSSTDTGGNEKQQSWDGNQ